MSEFKHIPVLFNETIDVPTGYTLTVPQAAEDIAPQLPKG